MRTLEFKVGQQFVVTHCEVGKPDRQVIYEALKPIAMHLSETDAELFKRCIEDGSIKCVDTGPGDSNGG
jgi:hypothetical protein